MSKFKNFKLKYFVLLIIFPPKLNNKFFCLAIVRRYKVLYLPHVNQAKIYLTELNKLK